MFDNIFGIFFNDSGNKIKNFAKWLFVIESISAIISSVVAAFVAMLDLGPILGILAGLAIIVLGSIFGIAAAWVTAIFIYGFGEIVDKHVTADTADTSKTTSPDKRVNMSKKDMYQAKKEYDKSKKNSSLNYPTVQDDEEEFMSEYADDGSIPQVICPKCGKEHDFDYPKCPKCNYKY